MSHIDIKMPPVADNKQWKHLLGDAKKVEYRCAECTRPINCVGYCNRCNKKDVKLKNN
tara:strand:- start:242 stop:415 length:174 start_codon:yes stop_codon:yes gene_type:complete